MTTTQNTTSGFYAEGTLLLDYATGITYRARRVYEDFTGKPTQAFSEGHTDGAAGATSELPATARVIWTPSN